MVLQGIPCGDTTALICHPRCPSSVKCSMDVRYKGPTDWFSHFVFFIVPSSSSSSSSFFIVVIFHLLLLWRIPNSLETSRPSLVEFDGMSEWIHCPKLHRFFICLWKMLHVSQPDVTFIFCFVVRRHLLNKEMAGTANAFCWLVSHSSSSSSSSSFQPLLIYSLSSFLFAHVKITLQLHHTLFHNCNTIQLID